MSTTLVQRIRNSGFGLLSMVFGDSAAQQPGPSHEFTYLPEPCRLNGEKRRVRGALGSESGVQGSVMHLYRIARESLPDGPDGLVALQMVGRHLGYLDHKEFSKPKMRAATQIHAFVDAACPDSAQTMRSMLERPGVELADVLTLADEAVKGADFEAVMRTGRGQTILQACRMPPGADVPPRRNTLPAATHLAPVGVM